MWERLRSVTAVTLAELVLVSQEDQGCVQVPVDLVNTVPRDPPIGGLGLLLSPECGGQDQEGGERAPASTGVWWVPPGPRSSTREHAPMAPLSTP